MAMAYIKNNSYDVDSSDYGRDTDEHGSNENDTSSSDSDDTSPRPRNDSEQSENSSTSQMANLVLDDTDPENHNASSASARENGRSSNKDYDFVKTYESLVKARIGVQERESGWSTDLYFGTVFIVG